MLAIKKVEFHVVPSSPDAGKGKCWMWAANKAEIHVAKIGFVDCKWYDLNAPGLYSPCCRSLLGSVVPFFLHAEKREMLQLLQK